MDRAVMLFDDSPREPETNTRMKSKAGPDPKPGGIRAWKLVAIFLILVGIPIAIWYFQRPLRGLRVMEDAQITHDGHRKWLGGTDGSRLYFNELAAITPIRSHSRAAVLPCSIQWGMPGLLIT
jgi:hypothetical protein